MTTTFGKNLRKIRIDHDEVLKDMAKRLDVSSSFLSAVEVGKKNVPKNWCQLIAQLYNLSDEEFSSLKKSAAESVNTVKMNLYGTENKQRKAALVFARTFDSLSDDDANRIINFMSHKSGDSEGE